MDVAKIVKVQRQGKGIKDESARWQSGFFLAWVMVNCGRLYDLLRLRGCIYMAISSNLDLAAVMANRWKRQHIVDLLNEIEVLIEKQKINLSNARWPFVSYEFYMKHIIIQKDALVLKTSFSFE